MNAQEPRVEHFRPKIRVSQVSSPTGMKLVPSQAAAPFLQKFQGRNWKPPRPADQTGWIVLADCGLEVSWNGGKDPLDIHIAANDPRAGQGPRSTRGNGLLTWNLPFRFSLPAGVALRVRGIANWYKAGVFPVERIIDTDAADQGIELLLAITQIGTPVRISVNEPLCAICPESADMAMWVSEEPATPDEAGQLLEREPTADGEKGVRATDREFNGAIISPSHRLDPVTEQTQGKQRSLSEMRVDSLGGAARESKATPWLITRLAQGPFHVETEFYDQFSQLRDQLARELKGLTSSVMVTSPLTYAYSSDSYRFIAAAADRIFDGEGLFRFLDRLRAWALPSLGAAHASTPRLQIHVGDCFRHLARDDVRAGWHYLLSLGSARELASTPNVFVEAGTLKVAGTMPSVLRTTGVSLKANELLIHPTGRRYGIERHKGSMDPLDGRALLDGYLW